MISKLTRGKSIIVVMKRNRVNWMNLIFSIQLCPMTFKCVLLFLNCRRWVEELNSHAPFYGAENIALSKLLQIIYSVHGIPYIQ